MAKRTQVERIITRLHMGGLCSQEVFEWQPPIRRLASRIVDIKAQGYTVEALHACPEHDGAGHAYYRFPPEKLF